MFVPIRRSLTSFVGNILAPVQFDGLGRLAGEKLDGVPLPMRIDDAMDLGSHYAAYIAQSGQCGSVSCLAKTVIDEVADGE